MPDFAAITDLDIIIHYRSWMNIIWFMLPRVVKTLSIPKFQGFLAFFQHIQNTQAFFTIGSWLFSRNQAIQKMTQLFPERFDSWELNSFRLGFTGNRFNSMPFYCMRINQKFILRLLGVIENHHPAVSHYNQTLFFEWM